MNKAWVAVTKDGKAVKKYAAAVKPDGTMVKVIFKTKTGKVTKQFKSIPGKPAMRVALETIMLRYKGYDPAVHSVTVLKREPKGE